MKTCLNALSCLATGVLLLALFACFPNKAAAQSDYWAWMGGSNPAVTAPAYGNEYVFAPANQPGPRVGTATWTDANGKMWLFGGSDGTISLNDLWVFDPTKGVHGEWAWMGGLKSGSCSAAYNKLACKGNYGTEYQFAAGNIPGSRAGAMHWLDSQGRIWLFGGLGQDSTNLQGFLNDLWVFDPAQGTHGEWAWMGGSKSVTCNSTGLYCYAAGLPGTKYQYGALNAPSGRADSVAWHDAAGKLWLFSGTSIALVAGQADLNSPSDLWVFDPAQGSHGEWAWMGGNLQNLAGLPQSGIYGTEYQFAATNWPSSRNGAASWSADDSGKVWVCCGDGYDAAGKPGNLNDLWVFDPAQGAHGEWAWMGGSNSVFSPGTFGTEFQFAPANVPGDRVTPVTWTGQDGRFWLLGGVGRDKWAHDGYLDDYWVFDPKQGSHGEWAWMGGHQAVICSIDSTTCTDSGHPAAYGTEYLFKSTNYPGGRTEGSTWTDGKGNLWLWGGLTDAESPGMLTDLFEFRFNNPQTISFSLPVLKYGMAPVNLGGTASSGLPVIYKLVSGPAKLSGTNNHILTVTGSGSAVQISASQGGNWEFSAAPSVTASSWANKAALTVHADNKSMTYGGVVPALTWGATGFVNGDTVTTALTGSPSLTTTVTSTTLPGTYAVKIVAGTLVAKNYTLAFKWGTLTVQPLGTVANPTFSLAAGTYKGAQTVTIGETTAGANIFYTTDGSTPSPSHGTHYTGPVSVSSSETLKAIATEKGYTSSAVVSASYSIQ